MRRRQPVRLCFIALGLALAIAAGLATVPGCNRSQAQTRGRSGPTAIPVTLRPVEIKPLQRTVDIVGTLYADEDTVISAKVAGRAIGVYKDVGDRVGPGEALAQISPVDYELARKQKELAAREPLAKLGLSELPSGDFDPAAVPTVKRARLQADNAKAKYDRGNQLHEQKPPLLSDQDFADLKTAYEVAASNYDVELLTAQSALAQARSLKAELDIAIQRLADSTARTPSPGDDSSGGGTKPAGKSRSYAVAARIVNLGEYVKEGTALFRLIDDDMVKLRAAVPERYAPDIAIGQQVRVNVAAWPNDFIGRVARINPAVEPVNRTFQIEVQIDNREHQLKGGSFARASVLIRMDERVVFVPQDAIVTFAGTSKVFTVADGKAVENIIETGQRRSDTVEAVTGLKGDESVVIEGASRLATGVAVSVKKPTTAPATRPAAVAAAREGQVTP